MQYSAKVAKPAALITVAVHKARKVYISTVFAP